MKKLLFILLLVYSCSVFGQEKRKVIWENVGNEQSILIWDKSDKITKNPYQNRLDRLYQNENDSMIIDYVYDIELPQLYFINSSKDTIHITKQEEKHYQYFLSFPQYINNKDSSLLSNVDQLYFDISINWDGEIYYIKVVKFFGQFNLDKWITFFSQIKAIPGTIAGIPKADRIRIPIIVNKVE